MTDNTKTGLSPVEQKFILPWGEMGTRWGVNRTVAQVRALLFLSPRPLSAEEIATTFGNSSTRGINGAVLRDAGRRDAEPFVQSI